MYSKKKRLFSRDAPIALLLMLTSTSTSVAEVIAEVGENDFLIGTTRGHSQVDVAYSEQADLYIVVSSEFPDFDVVIQRVDAQGGLIGPKILAGFYGGNPTITHDPVNDRFLVTAALDNSLVGVLVDPSGSPGTPFQIAGSSVGPHHVAYNPIDGLYLLTFNYDLFLRARRIDESGQVLGVKDTLLRLIIASQEKVFSRLVFNPTRNEFVVTWTEAYSSGPVVWAMRIDGASGLQLGTESEISGGEAADRSDIAYNPVHDEYFVIWRQLAGSVGGDEIYGRRFDSLLEPLGVPTQVSTMGRPIDADAHAQRPRISYNTRRDRYLVAWSGDDQENGMVDDEFEIFGQYLSWGGGRLEPVGNFRISEVGGTGFSSPNTLESAIAYNSLADEYLVVFGVNDLFEGDLLGQRLYGAPTIFSDGFESGGVHRWSSSTP